MSTENRSDPPTDWINDLDLSQVSWVPVIRVLPPDDIIIESLLRSHGIPFRLEHTGISQMPLTVGPFAEIEFSVPGPLEETVRTLLEPGDPMEESPED